MHPGRAVSSIRSQPREIYERMNRLATVGLANIACNWLMMRFLHRLSARSRTCGSNRRSDPVRSFLKRHRSALGGGDRHGRHLHSDDGSAGIRLRISLRHEAAPPTLIGGIRRESARPSGHSTTLDGMNRARRLRRAGCALLSTPSVDGVTIPYRSFAADD
jgi:hypothetical protein